jgi:hypothetical protein
MFDIVKASHCKGQPGEKESFILLLSQYTEIDSIFVNSWGQIEKQRSEVSSLMDLGQPHNSKGIFDYSEQ